MKSKAKLILLLLLYTLPLLMAAPKAIAITTQGVSLEPAFQELTLDSTENSINGTIQLSNDTDVQLPVKIVALDIEQVDSNGNINFIEKPEANNAFRVAEFITFEKTTFILEPKSKSEVSFKIQNSSSLSPGGHYGAIIARFESKSDDSNQKVFPAISSLILVRKTGGEQYHISLTKVANIPNFITLSIPKKIDLTFSNDGNIHTIPYGTVIYKNVFGGVAFKGIINESSSFVLPENQRVIVTNLHKIDSQLPFMFYTVSIEGKTRPGEVPYNWQGSFLYISPLLIAFLIIVLGILLVVYKKKLRKKNEKTIENS